MRFIRFSKCRVLAAVGFVCFGALAGPAVAATLVVRNTNDASTDSLRQKILEANPAGGDTILFQIPTSSPGYNPNTGVFTIGLTSAELVIDKSLTIDGSAQRISIRRTGGTQFRIVRIVAGTTVTLNDLAISNGYESSAAGISNSGNLTLRNCTLYDNTVPPGGAQGGAIVSGLSLRVSNCTFTGNTAVQGTAIFSGGDLTIDNSTIVGNGSGNGAVVKGGSGTARVRNTIIAGNTVAGGDVSGVFVSEGYNLIGTLGPGTTGFGAMGDVIGVTAAQVNLGSLQDNGGPTLTRKPLAGSLAIDQGNRGVDGNGQPINTDQRGQPRPVDLAPPNASGGDGSDVGAVEVGSVQAGPAFIVTTTLERNDGSCTTDDCTLVEALNASNANVNAGANTISFAPGVSGTISTFQLTPSGLAITNPVTINGPGAQNLSISVGGLGRVFRMSAAGTATISGLTLADGYMPGDNGGNVYVSSGTLKIIDSVIRNGRALNNGSFGGSGGGCYNAAGATLELVRCTISGNLGDDYGGGVYTEGNFTATNCTFTTNTAQLRGGGIILRGAAQITLHNCTITNNRANDGVVGAGFGGGGLFCEGSASQHFLGNTIIAGNSATNDSDVRGNYTSQGHNLIGRVGDSTGLVNGVNGDIVGNNATGVNPQLGVLAYNGGRIPTVSLLSNSPAINAGDDALAPATDQRGFGRNGVSDIGAFEFNGVPPPVSLLGGLSRQTHGSSGDFDLNLALAGTPTVESRSGGANSFYSIIFAFTNPVNATGAVVTSGTGNVLTLGYTGDPNQYIVNLTGVTNAQNLSVSLTNVTDSLGNFSSSVPLSVGILIGDANGDGSVNSGDATITRARSGQSTNPANFRTDYNLDGFVNAADATIVRVRSGSFIP